MMPLRGCLGTMLVVILGGCLCRAEITNIRVTGTTSTQAVIVYSAPDSISCSVEVSESPSYAPVVRDVDEDLFAGSSWDSRPGSITRGRYRLVAIGKHGMTASGATNQFLAADGNRYSRALQANTLHYYRIRCGGEVATGAFSTGAIQLGSSYPETLAADPANPGVYNWPAVTNPSSRAESIVDPATGALIRKITMSSESNAPWNKNAWPSGGMLDRKSVV